MRNIVITGASSGIGRALALERASAGDQVWATVRRAADAAELVEASKGRIRPLLLDVCNREAVRGAAETIHAATRDTGLQALINNAGVVVSGPLEHIEVEAFREQLEVNLVAPLAMAQALLPELRRGGGRIIQVGSISGQLTVPFLGPYSVSKTGLAVLSRALRMELAPWRIPVCLVVLGNYQTPLWGKALSGQDDRTGLYTYYLDRAYELAEKQASAAADVSRAVQALAHVITARYPKPVYRVGALPRILELLSHLLPSSLIDRILRWIYRLHRPRARTASLPARSIAESTKPVGGGKSNSRS